MAKLKALAHLHMPTVMFLKVSSKMIELMDKAYTNILLDKFMMGSGSMICSMDKVLNHLEMDLIILEILN